MCDLVCKPQFCYLIRCSSFKKVFVCGIGGTKSKKKTSRKHLLLVCDLSSLGGGKRNFKTHLKERTCWDIAFYDMWWLLKEPFVY